MILTSSTSSSLLVSSVPLVPWLLLISSLCSLLGANRGFVRSRMSVILWRSLSSAISYCLSDIKSDPTIYSLVPNIGLSKAGMLRATGSFLSSSEIRRRLAKSVEYNSRYFTISSTMFMTAIREVLVEKPVNKEKLVKIYLYNCGHFPKIPLNWQT